MAKVVNLTVHKNTARDRTMRKASDALMRMAHRAAGGKGVAGFVLVAWDWSGNPTIGLDNEAERVRPGDVPFVVRREVDRLFKSEE